ncbi:MAG: membrane dipeptidase [Bacilli bacterium]
MKIFDTHTDILYDLYISKTRGKENRFKDVHVAQLKDSVIKGGLWTVYSPDKFDLIEAIKIALAEIDMSLLPGFELMLGLEGLLNLEKVEDMRVLYDLGIRHAMLTWNEENKYATGVAGDKDHGLKEEGKKLLDLMMELDMIIDVAHLNEKSFYDVLNYTNKNIIYSHGNVKSICDHRRNLTTEQMQALRKANGLFGLTLAKNFVSKNEEKQDLEHFLNHVDEAVKIMDIDHVMFGFDFMDYLSDDFPNSNIVDVGSAPLAYRIIDGLVKRGYSNEDINKICYTNFVNRYSRHFIKLRGAK